VDLFERMQERYAAGNVPWDEPLPPPEVRDYVHANPPGRALDLGCGYGRAAIYLAGRGWDVDGVEFIEAALMEARARARAAGVSPRFHLSPVTDLSFLPGPYDFALDVGCMHNLDQAGLLAYREELLRLLRPGGRYLLFARLDEQDAEGPKGIDEGRLRDLFAPGFALERVERGRTDMADGSSWQSAWFWFCRL
jgi:SAM-dependent methyltransferase